MYVFTWKRKKKNKKPTIIFFFSMLECSIYVQMEWLVVKAGLTNFLITEKQKYFNNGIIIYGQRAFN